METIKNYIESMFRNLPQTEKVLRAKSELFQMMEDKYTELIKEGKSENEAVGTVISEFGNLEELSGTLGISDIFKTSREDSINRRKLTFDEITGFIDAKREKAKLVATGVFLCIVSVIGPIIADAYNLNDGFGIIPMFAMIAIGIACFIIAGSKTADYKFLHQEITSIDAAEKEFLINKRRELSNTHSIRLSVGILLCIFCFVPPIIFDDLGIYEDLAPVLMFLIAGTGVFLIVQTNICRRAYDVLLGVNSKSSFDLKKENGEEIYANKTVRVIMAVYWQTITCIYLCVSFLTGTWYISWIIWPIAGIARKLIVTIFEDPELSEKERREIYE